MYSEAYALIREILEDEKLNEFVVRTTGKKLAVIDSGPQVTVPAAGIFFNGGPVSRGENTVQDAEYRVAFALPYWGADGMRLCHEFLDVAVEAFFSHELGRESGPGRRNYVKTLEPFLAEDDPEKQWWTVGVQAVVSMFRE